MVLFLNTTKFHFSTSPICLFYHVIQKFVQYALFSEIQAVRRGWGTMYDKG